MLQHEYKFSKISWGSHAQTPFSKGTGGKQNRPPRPQQNCLRIIKIYFLTICDNQIIACVSDSTRLTFSHFIENDNAERSY
jgi:hypothetical protein